MVSLLLKRGGPRWLRWLGVLLDLALSLSMSADEPLVLKYRPKTRASRSAMPPVSFLAWRRK
jgi:hypothetical protein